MQNMSPDHDDAAIGAFIDGLIAAAAAIRMPELFTGDRDDAVYQVPDRQGVTTVILRTRQLTEEQLTQLMRYRLAQYLAVNFVDHRMIYAAQMEYEPLANLHPDDLHLLAGSVATGEILCYAVLEAPPETTPTATLRDRDRPLFPVERVHGWGIYNRLRLLPDQPMTKLREMGRFVKNQRLHSFNELGARAPVEIIVAVFRLIAGPLRLEVEALIGDLEEGVVAQNLEFFHVPKVVIHGTVPYEAEASYFFPRYQFCTVYPFATLSSDISGPMLARLTAIEEALAQPGKRGLLALFALKRDARAPKSSLEPPGGLAPMTDVSLEQRAVAMGTRRQMLDMGDQLRQMPLFAALSVAEATVLGSFMTHSEAEDGAVIVRQGEDGDALFMIEAGEAQVRIADRDGQSRTVATLGAGDYFGEIALLTGAQRIADVVAVGPLSLLTLDKDAYARYLAHIAEVDGQLARTAVVRASDTMRQLRTGDARPGPTPRDDGR